MEYFFVGHPVGAHHVAWNDGPDWDINPHFVGQVKKVASMNRPIVLICRSGHRSLDAGVALEKAGFSDVYNVLDGFEGPLDEATTAAASPAGGRKACPGSSCDRAPDAAVKRERHVDHAGQRVVVIRRAFPETQPGVEPARVGHPVERVEPELR